MKMLRALALFIVGLAMGGMALAADADPQNLLYMDLPFGRVVIQLRLDLAPNACAQIKKLTRAGFYDGVVFHRVIAGFMAQGGDPTGTGTGGSGHPLHAEFTNSEKFVRGVVGMARSSDPNSVDSQFYIMYDAAPALDGKYTIVGKVISGMEFVDQLKKGDPAQNGIVTNPDKIVKMQVASDAIAAGEKANQPKPKEPADSSLGETPKLHQ
ncbi:MAG TPA: peptidylprolyl isomerase [Stellaceae bacterium]|nr:peptidylprolyl isomerase [Stellaceae bacterium]